MSAALNTIHHEQCACDNTSGRPMHKPTDVNCELLCLGTRQQHAIVQRVQKSVLGNPMFLFDQNSMHHRNLSCQATKA